MENDDVKEKIDLLIENIRKVIYIERRKLEYIIASQIAGGHVILADSYGVGKTSLARALAGSIFPLHRSGTSADVQPFCRIQCTVDLLPQDIIGFTRFDGKSGDFVFRKGPIFSNFILCDEINMLTPKTQGSFFQAMEEQKVSAEGETYDLPSPFFIIATMNLEGSHLFPLPAPQLDRFMIRLSMGMPSFKDECAIVKQHGREDGWKDLRKVITSEDINEFRSRADSVTVKDGLIEYIVKVVSATRAHPEISCGASPRAGVKIYRLSKALSLIRGENFVSPDTVKELLVPALCHRIVVAGNGKDLAEVISSIAGNIRIER